MLMDLSKVERQAPAEERHSEPSNYLKILLQDFLCFFILLSLALLIVAGILCVADDITRLQQRQRDPIKGSQGLSSEETTRKMHRYLRPPTWIRFFSCRRHRPEQDAKLEHLQEPEQNQEQGQVQEEGKDHGQGEGQHEKLEERDRQQTIAPTYEPINLPQKTRLQAGGDKALGEAASNEVDLDY